MESLYGLFYESMLKYPEKTFIYDMDRSWTYNEVYFISKYLSEHMLECGVQKGDRVVILCDNSVQYVAAFFAILRISAIAVPVNPAKMIDSFLYIVGKCSPRLILVCDKTAGMLEKIRGRQNRTGHIINIDRCGVLHDGKYTAGAWPESREYIEEYDRSLRADKNNIAEILFTSGTTAEPKGVMLTHGSLIANTEAIVDYLKLTCDDSVLMTLPFTYSYGNSVLLTHASVGGAIILENSTVFPYMVLTGIKKYCVTGFSTVGSYFNLIVKCIKNSDVEEIFFDNLRYITLAGEATSNDDILYIKSKYPHIEVFNMYGQTEASARLSYLSSELALSKLGSIGKGLSNVVLKVVDDEGREIKPGETGEIIAYGPNIMKGYWEDPDATENVLKYGWLYTGDIATVDDDGFIYIKGRKTDMIKHMGHRISPSEIENVINSCSYIRESAVVEDSIDGISVIKAFIVPENECPVEEVKKFVYSRLPAYMRPSDFIVIDQLPRTDSGKIMRSTLRRKICAE